MYKDLKVAKGYARIKFLTLHAPTISLNMDLSNLVKGAFISCKIIMGLMIWYVDRGDL